MDIGMKRNIVLFTSQMIKKEGIRAVRMDNYTRSIIHFGQILSKYFLQNVKKMDI